MNYFDVFPKIVPANRISTIRIRPRFEQAAFPDIADIAVEEHPFDGCDHDGIHRGFRWSAGHHNKPEFTLDADGVLHVRCFFAGETEHMLQIAVTKPGTNQKVTRSIRIYSLEDDLFKLRPFKGDFHIHTTRSDGQEAPVYVAARYRQKGFDFAAVSDHLRYAPSLEAIDYWKPYGLPFKLYPGEEVHAPDNPVHIINFGATSSVNDFCKEHEATYREEVQSILDAMPDKRDDMDMFAVASSEWVFDRIRRNGGLAVYCHPYWYVTQNVISEALADQVFKRRGFDALELFGGYYRTQSRSNNFQIARCVDEWVSRGKFPVVGLSDAHGTDRFDDGDGWSFTESKDRDLFNWYYTLVFSPDDSVTSLVRAMRENHCVAVQQPEGERAEIFGDFRLVKYADFLRREYFPIHDRYCETEGILMLECLAGEDASRAALDVVKDRVPAFRERCFASDDAS